MYINIPNVIIQCNCYLFVAWNYSSFCHLEPLQVGLCLFDSSMDHFDPLLFLYLSGKLIMNLCSTFKISNTLSFLLKAFSQQHLASGPIILSPGPLHWWPTHHLHVLPSSLPTYPVHCSNFNFSMNTASRLQLPCKTLQWLPPLETPWPDIQ